MSPVVEEKENGAGGGEAFVCLTPPSLHDVHVSAQLLLNHRSREGEPTGGLALFFFVIIVERLK